MTALIRDTDSPKKYAQRFTVVPAAATAKAFEGGLLAANATGFGTPAANTAGHKVLGRCTQGGDNSAGADGAMNFVCERGVFKFTPTAALLALGQAAVGTKCYVKDDATVGTAADCASLVVAGIVDEFDAADGLFYVAVGLGAEYSGSVGEGDLLTVADSAVSPAAVSEGVAVTIPIDLPDAADATYVYKTTDKIEIVDAWCIKDGAGAGNTVQVTDAADAAITNAMAFAVDKTVTRAGTIDKAKRVVNAGGTFKVVNLRAAGSSAGQLFIRALKRA